MRETEHLRVVMRRARGNPVFVIGFVLLCSIERERTGRVGCFRKWRGLVKLLV